jgi:hypothetical protein
MVSHLLDRIVVTYSRFPKIANTRRMTKEGPKADFGAVFMNVRSNKLTYSMHFIEAIAIPRLWVLSDWVDAFMPMIFGRRLHDLMHW